MAEVIKMGGTVRSVNGIEPDENANVDIGENVRFIPLYAHVRVGINANTYTDDNGITWSTSSQFVLPDMSKIAKRIILSRSFVTIVGYEGSGSNGFILGVESTNLINFNSQVYNCCGSGKVNYVLNDTTTKYPYACSLCTVDLPLTTSAGERLWCLVTLAYVPLDASTSA